jgi:MFS family permease
VGKDFRLIWLGRSLSIVGDGVIPAALALAVVAATGSAGALAFVLTCATVPQLALLPVGGAVADRWPARRVAIAGDVVRCVVQAVVAIELISGRFRLVDLAVASAVCGAAAAFARPTTAPLIAASVGAEFRPRANALLGVSGNVGRVLGPALGGTLVLTVGAGWAFAVDAATFALSAVTLSGIRIARQSLDQRYGQHPDSLPRSVAVGLREVRRHTWLWTSLIGHAVWNLAASVVATLGPLIAVRALGGGVVWVSVLQAAAIGLLAGSVLATRIGAAGRFSLKITRPVLIANLTLAIYAVPLTALALAAPAPVLIGAFAVAFAGAGFLNPVWDSTMQQHVPADKLARVASLDMLVAFVATPLGYALAAPVAATFGATPTLLGTALLVTVTTAGTAASRSVRTLRVDGRDRDVEPVPATPDPRCPQVRARA